MPLQDSDNFIIGRGTDSYKITYEDLKDDLNYVPPPVGTINQPTVLEPNDGAGGGDTRYLKSDAITEIEGGGIKTCETDEIQSVDDTTDAPNVILTFPSSNGFDCFEPGDVVQDPDVKSSAKTKTPTPSPLTVASGLIQRLGTS